MADTLPADLAGIYAELKSRNTERDNRHKDVSNARRGNVHAVMPGVFPTSWPKPIVANVIDTTAKDLARVLARMPAVDCSTGNATSEKAKQFAAKRTKVALHYIDKSRLKKQLYVGADWYFTFGAMPIILEPDIAGQFAGAHRQGGVSGAGQRSIGAAGHQLGVTVMARGMFQDG